MIVPLFNGETSVVLGFQRITSAGKNSIPGQMHWLSDACARGNSPLCDVVVLAEELSLSQLSMFMIHSPPMACAGRVCLMNSSISDRSFFVFYRKKAKLLGESDCFTKFLETINHMGV